jgi:hypothetical protein
MKSLFTLLCLLSICIIGQAQDRGLKHQIQPGSVYYVDQADLWGFPPKNDPNAGTTINPAYISPIDGSGPIALDPTKSMTVNPYILYAEDGIYPWPDPNKGFIINPNYLIPEEGSGPIALDPHRRRVINPVFLVPED